MTDELGLLQEIVKSELALLKALVAMRGHFTDSFVSFSAGRLQDVEKLKALNERLDLLMRWRSYDLRRVDTLEFEVERERQALRSDLCGK